MIQRNPLIRRNKTLAELMAELRSRLGFVSQGPAASSNDGLITSFLQEAHDYVYGELLPPAQRKRTQIQLAAGSYLYDWHNDQEDEDIDPADLIGMWIVGPDARRTRLYQRPVDSQVDMTEPSSEPSSYSTLNGQIELHPVPDAVYLLELEYLAGKSRFNQPDDRPSVPDRLVFQYALANAKAHFRHPDSQAAGSAFTAMLSKEKTRLKESRRYFVTRCIDPDEPHVERGGDGGYYLRG